MKTTCRVTKITVRGSVSYRMTLPHEFIDALKFEGNRDVELSLVGEKLVITKASSKTLKESDLIKSGWVKVDSDKRSKIDVWYNHRKEEGDKFMTISHKDIIRSRRSSRK